jgi:hypothetical protein
MAGPLSSFHHTERGQIHGARIFVLKCVFHPSLQLPLRTFFRCDKYIGIYAQDVRRHRRKSMSNVHYCCQNLIQIEIR